jgi:hydrogenase expression/formation protein HypC
MHEIGMCEGLIDLIERCAGGRPVAAVRIRVGVRHGVVDEALDQAFALAAAGTVAAGASVDLVVTPVTMRCRSCGQLASSSWSSSPSGSKGRGSSSRCGRSGQVCLGIPGEVIEVLHDRPDLAQVDVSGVRRAINIGLLESDPPRPGDWVLIHVGFALSKIDEAEAKATLDFLEGVGLAYADELQALAESRIE